MAAYKSNNTKGSPSSVEKIWLKKRQFFKRFHTCPLKAIVELTIGIKAIVIGTI